MPIYYNYLGVYATERREEYDKPCICNVFQRDGHYEDHMRDDSRNGGADFGCVKTDV